MPNIRERPASLSPAFKFKKFDRKATDRPKTVTNFDNVLKKEKCKSPKNLKSRIIKFKKNVNK